MPNAWHTARRVVDPKRRIQQIARTDRIDADAVLRHFQRQALGQADAAKFGGRILAVLVAALLARLGVDLDNDAAAPGPSSPAQHVLLLRKKPVRLTSMTSRQSARLNSSTGPERTTPALATRMSSRPNSATTRSHDRLHLGFVGDIDGKCQRAPPGLRPDLPGRQSQPVRPSGQLRPHAPPSWARRRQSDSAQPLCAASYQCHTIL